MASIYRDHDIERADRDSIGDGGHSAFGEPRCKIASDGFSLPIAGSPVYGTRSPGGPPCRGFFFVDADAVARGADAVAIPTSPSPQQGCSVGADGTSFRANRTNNTVVARKNKSLNGKTFYQCDVNHMSHLFFRDKVQR